MKTITIDGKDYLGYVGIADLTGYAVNTLRGYKVIGRMPEEDGHIGNQPLWLVSTVEKWMEDFGIESTT